MRWIFFLILAGLFLIGQTSLAPRVEILNVRPDWMFILVVFIALHAQGPDAMLGGWVLGLMADVCSDERMGLFALVYGLSALVLVRLRTERGWIVSRMPSVFTRRIAASLSRRTAPETTVPSSRTKVWS